MSTFEARKTAASNMKLLATSALTAAGMFAPITAMAQNVAPNALPQDPTVTSGAATFDYSEPSTLTITQLQALTSAEYAGGFNIGNAAAVFVDQNTGDVFVHIDKSDNTSFIEGIFEGSGSNFVLNKNGVVITGTARIDMHAFGASTAGQFDIVDGNLEMSDFGDAAIDIQQGAVINVGAAGLAAFVSPTITNAGVINAKLGRVAFASGDTVTIDLYGDGLFEVAVDGELADAMIENTGTISAEGGEVQITALAAKETVDNLINVDGVVTVASAEVQGGKIILSGGNKGTVAVKGKLDASGKTGGEIEVTGELVAALDGAELDASGTNGGGEIRFGGDYQGGGDTPTSDYAYVGQDAILRADATEEGDGGDVIVWSDKNTAFLGEISATGGANGGDGGFVETSAKEYLVSTGSVDASAENGAAGEWLLDPRNIEIDDVANNSEVSIVAGDPTTITASSGSFSNVDVDTIEDALEAGTSVTLRTASGGSGDGDINVNTEINKDLGGNATLRLESHDDINVDNGIIATVGELTVELIAGFFEGDGAGNNNDVNINANIDTNGGDFLAQADDDVAVKAIITTDGGDVTLNATSAGSVGTVEISGAGLIDTTRIGFDGDVSILAEDINFGAGTDRIITADGAQQTDDGSVTIDRSSDGDISLGDDNGSLHISQAELETISTRDLTVGGTNTRTLTVDNVDTTTVASRDVTLLAQDPPGNENREVRFQGTNTFNAVKAEAIDDIKTSGGSTVTTTSGTLEFVAAEEIELDGNIFTQGGDAVFTAGTTLEIDDATDTINTTGTTQDGNVEITADTLDLGGTIDTGVGDVAIGRVTLGVMSLGDDNGGLHIDQDEAGRISAGSLTLGNNRTNELFIDNIDATSSGLVTLKTQADTGLEDNVNFAGTNVFSELLVNSNDHIILQDDAIVETTTGDATFTGDSNAFSAGDFVAGVNTLIETNGNNLNIDVNNIEFGDLSRVLTNDGNITLATSDAFGGGTLTLGNDTNLDAGAGNIQINNEGIFASAGADSLSSNGGTITLNQFEGGSLQNAIDALNNTGAGQNTLLVHAGEYNENLTINQANLKLTGLEQGVIDGPDAIIAGTDNSAPTILVEESNFHLDPVVVDANGADYGLSASGAGADGLIVDGNTFRDSAEAGIFIEANSTSTADIKNNTFEGDATRGIETGTLDGGFTLEITDNTIGTDIDTVQNGLKIGNVRDATVNVTRGTIDSSNDGIQVAGAGRYSEFNFTNVDIEGGDEGIDFNTRINGTVNVDGGNIIGDGNGLETNRINGRGSVNVFNNANIEGGTDARGINILGQIRGLLDVANSTITGGDAGIGRGGSNFAAVNGGTVNVTNSTITGTTGDGIELGAVSNGGTVDIDGNVEISGGDNGILIAGEISGAATTVTIENNTLIDGVNGNGIQLAGEPDSISGGATVTIENNTITAGDDGLDVEANITGAGTTLNVLDNDITVDGDGVDIDGVQNGATVNIGGPLADNGNVIDAGSDGIEFDAGVDSTVLIEANRISADDNGILIAELDAGGVTSIDNGAIVSILNNQIGSVPGDTIGDDGIQVVGSLTGGSTLTIAGNTIGRFAFGGFVGDDGIQVEAIDGGATLNITDNDVSAADNGIEINGDVDGGIVNISEENRLFTGDNGVEFNGNITGDADIDVNDNIVRTNFNFNGTGTGILFNGTVDNANIQIGDGTLPGGADRSNIIAGVDGVVFADTVGENAVIAVDGNRIGFRATSLTGDLFNARLAGDGVTFADVTSNAQIDVTENAIRTFGQGVAFDGTVDGTSEVTIGGSADFANDINSATNGVAFNQGLTGNTNVEISHNEINTGGSGILFDGDVNNVAAGGVSQDELLIASNDIEIFGGGSGIRFTGSISDNRHDTEITANTIEVNNGSQNGITFDGEINDATVNIRNGNTIRGDEDGIEFGGDITNNARIRINNNTEINGEDEEGISFVGTINNSIVNINGNTEILADSDGIIFDGEITNARVTINNNEEIIADDVNGIDFNADITNGSFVSINGNDNISGDLAGREASINSGIEFEGVNNARVEILGNNEGIMAEDHGIVFNGDIANGSDIDIHDNIIMSNLDSGVTGTGILFDGTVTDSDINIGDGALNGAPSNIISVTGRRFDQDLDGIRFGDEIGDGADILIDGNRIGFKADSLAGPLTPTAIVADGIDFAAISGDAEIEITDNNINVNDDGIQFNDTISGTASIIIGETPSDADGNTITAGGDGVIFFGDVTEQSQIQIIDNTIDSDRADGVSFRGTTSNVIAGSNNEIFITENDITGARNGVSFEGQASGRGHNIRIEDNTAIEGERGNGVNHTGGIDNANLQILRNDDIQGGTDGVRVAGEFENNGRVRVRGNTQIFGIRDGISIEDTTAGGSNVRILNNRDVSTSDGSGILAQNVDDVLIQNNTVDTTGLHGISVLNSDNAEILGNFVGTNDGPNNIAGIGINVADSDGANIDGNTVNNNVIDGISVDNGTDITINGNFLDNNALFGGSVALNDVTTATVSNNIITNSRNEGMTIFGSDGINILTNEISDSATAGLRVAGADNGTIALVGNTFTDNPVGARFESGEIDLTGGTNTFDNTDPLGLPVGLQFDLADPTDPTTLTITGNTLGTTTFTGFENLGSFFVRLEDGALLDAGGGVIEVDGVNASFNGFSPASQGGILSLAQLTLIEDRLFDVDDTAGRGQIFVGALPLINPEEFLQERSTGEFGETGATFFVAGLPPLDVNPADIQPAAGDEEGAEGGTTAEDFADIEPAAGDEEVSCWNDAVNAADSGTGVSYSFGGSFEESLADAAACGS